MLRDTKAVLDVVVLSLVLADVDELLYNPVSRLNGLGAFDVCELNGLFDNVTGNFSSCRIFLLRGWRYNPHGLARMLC